MKRVRFALDPNPCQPLAFDWICEAVLPPATEERTHQRVPLGYRVSADLVRYHQIGTASGWVEIDGVRAGDRPRRVGVDPRPLVGGPLRRGHTADRCRPLQSGGRDGLPDDLVPVLMTDPDGTRWGLFMHLIDVSGFGHRQRTVTGAVEHLDGRVERMADIRPDLAFDPANRRLLGRPGVGHPGGRLGACLPARGPHRHRVPPRGRASTSAGRATTTANGGASSTWTGSASRTAGTPRWPVSSTSSGTPSSSSTTSTPGPSATGNCQPMITGAHPSLGLTADSSFW